MKKEYKKPSVIDLDQEKPIFPVLAAGYYAYKAVKAISGSRANKRERNLECSK